MDLHRDFIVRAWRRTAGSATAVTCCKATVFVVARWWSTAGSSSIGTRALSGQQTSWGRI